MNGQHDGDDGGQALRDRRHGQGHRREKHVQNVPVLKHPHAEHHGTHAHAHQGKDLGDLAHLPLEGRLPLLLAEEEAGDLPHLRVHAGAGHNDLPPAPGDDGAADDHVFPLGQGGVRGQAAAVSLGHGPGLAGHRRLVRLQPGFP